VVHAHAGETVEEHARLVVALVLVQRQMTAQHAEAGAAESYDGRGEASSVPAGGEREEDVLRTFDRCPQVAEDRGARGCAPSGEDDQP
jgi:hypothetical protein